MSTAFRIERHGATEVWVVDRPAARNAIDEDVVRGLRTAVAAAELDASLRAVVLTGAGDAAFIAGADLKFLRAALPEARSAMDAHMFEILSRIEALPIPVIAALNGVAMGGGSEVALACDMRIAEPDASITFKHAAMGVTPGWGGLSRLVALVGRGAAARLLFTATPVRPEDALHMGLVDELVPYGRGKERALEVAAAIAETSPSAVADIKRLLSLAYQEGPFAAREEERRTFLVRAASADHAEALAAYFERRAPRFAPRSTD